MNWRKEGRGGSKAKEEGRKKWREGRNGGGMVRGSERLLPNHAKTLGSLASGGEEFNSGPETRLDRSELLCNKVLLKYKGDRETSDIDINSG